MEGNGFMGFKKNSNKKIDEHLQGCKETTQAEDLKKLNIFESFGREIPIGISKLELQKLAEQISFAKKMSFEEVLLVLSKDQTRAVALANQTNFLHSGKKYTFLC